MTKVRSNRTARSCLLFLSCVLSFLATSCGSDNNNSSGATEIADGSILAPDTPINPTFPPATPGSEDPNALVVAVKYVALKSSSTSAASPTRSEVEKMLANVSNLWGRECSVYFILEEYETAVAGNHALDYTPAYHSQQYDIRRVFDDGRQALIVKTGLWDRSGDLGSSNAYSTMPGVSPEGIVVENNSRRSDISTMLIAHELGHLIGGLGHTSGTNLMNHYVSSSNTDLTSSQCDSARSTLRGRHAAWLR